MIYTHTKIPSLHECQFNLQFKHGRIDTHACIETSFIYTTYMAYNYICLYFCRFNWAKGLYYHTLKVFYPSPLIKHFVWETFRVSMLFLAVVIYLHQGRILRGGVERCAPPLRSFCTSPENFCTSPERSCISPWESFNDGTKWKCDGCFSLRSGSQRK
jgi:hypothetical protein